jgi:DNA-binding GntR family transcriptional regulator
MTVDAAAGEVETGSLVDRAYGWLKRSIVTNELSAGAFIDDAKIALGLGMSRTPVRDALRLLQAQGYVEVLPRKATRVAFLNVQDMRQIYQIITALEVQAVSLLVQRRPGAVELEPLHQAVVAMRAAEGGELPEWHEADERFHRALLQLCGNARLAAVAFEYRDFVQRAHLVALRLRSVTKRSTETHADLVALIAAGDSQGAYSNHLGQRTRMEHDLIGAVERAGLRML